MHLDLDGVENQATHLFPVLRLMENLHVDIQSLGCVSGGRRTEQAHTHKQGYSVQKKREGM